MGVGGGSSVSGQVEDWVAGLLAPETPPSAPAEDSPAASPDLPATSPDGEKLMNAAPETIAKPAPAAVPAKPAPARPAPAPAEMAAAPAETAAAQEKIADEPPRRYVTFRVARETYALDVLRVREVLRSAEVVPVPGAPDSVLGVINLRGSIVPVVDARHRLGLAPASPDAPSRVLIMESGWQAVGLRVDSVADVTTVTNEECEAPPPMGHGEESRCLRGIVRRDDEFMILVDVDDLLPRAREATAEPLR